MSERKNVVGSPFIGMRQNQQFARLPVELLTKTAANLPTGNPVTTANDLTNFKLASRTARNSVEGGRLGRFNRQLNRLGELSKKIYNAVIAPNHFQTDQSGPEEFVTPASWVLAIGPTLKFQSDERQANLATKVLDIQDRNEQASAVEAMSRYFDDFNKSDQERLFFRAIEFLGETGPQHAQARDEAATTLVNIHGQLDVHAKAAILDAMHANPSAFRIYLRALEDDARSETFDIASNGTFGNPEEVQELSVDDEIQQLSDMVAALDETHSNRVGTLRSVAETVPEVYDKARRELMNSTRERTGSGHEL